MDLDWDVSWTRRPWLRQVAGLLGRLLRVVTGTEAVHRLPVWIVGTRYDAGPPGDEALEAVRWTRAWVGALQQVETLWWFTYRRDLQPPVGPWTSDAGWGCMIRAGQMLLAAAWQRHDAAVSDGHPPPIFTWFGDSPAAEAWYSLHHLCADGQQRWGAPPGTWYGPGTMGHLLAARCRAHIASMHGCRRPLVVVVADGGTLVAAEVEAALRAPGTPGVLVWVATRLGLAGTVDDVYRQRLGWALTLSQSVGAVGGPPRRAVYIVGVHLHSPGATADLGAPHFLYLDPHQVQVAVAGSEAWADPRVRATFHCSTPRWLAAGDMDPSVAVGFYVQSLDDWADLCLRWQEGHLTDGAHPLWSVVDAATASPTETGSAAPGWDDDDVDNIDDVPTDVNTVNAGEDTAEAGNGHLNVGGLFALKPG